MRVRGARRSHASTPAATRRPSAMAQTTSDCPRGGVTRGEDAGHAGRAARVGAHVAACIEREAELLDDPTALRARRNPSRGARDQRAPRARSRGAAPSCPFEHDAHGLERDDARPSSPRKERVDTRPVALGALLVRRGSAQHERPLGPGVAGMSHERRLRHELELRHARRALAVRRAHAVGARIAAADDDDALARREDGARGLGLLAGEAAVLLREELHREVHAAELAARDRADRAAPVRRCRGRPRRTRAAAARLARRARRRRRAEDHALGAHLLHALVEDALLHLEVGNAVAEEATDAVVALEDHDVMPRPRELLRGRHPRGARSDDGDALARALARGGCGASAPAERTWSAMVRSMVLMVTGSSRDREDARRLARGRAHAPGDLGEVVRRQRAAAPRRRIALVDEVVPLRDEVAERTALVAEGMPQSMQREACRRTCGGSPGTTSSRQSRTRSSMGRSSSSTRGTLAGNPSDRPCYARSSSSSSTRRHSCGMHLERSAACPTPRAPRARARCACGRRAPRGASARSRRLRHPSARGPRSPC